MFVVTEAEAAAIRAVYQQRGEFAAAVELRRRFPGITDNAQARECARPDHRQLEAAAAAAGEADAEAATATTGALKLAWCRGLSRLKSLPPNLGFYRLWHKLSQPLLVHCVFLPSVCRFEPAVAGRI
jgi:hypothetical protein